MPILTPEERIGSTVAGKYQLDRLLGRGGMGVVFAAHHKWTSRKVALKMLKHDMAESPEVVRRFLREAKAAATLKHPAVVDVLDMGQDTDGSVYLALELLEGESLCDRLERVGKLDVETTIAILLPVLDALAEAHANGIVHRDLKPDNIFLSKGERGVEPKVLDFGIAKVAEANKSLDTATGTLLGTPHYMSPEQAAGRSDVGPASDVWSMAVVVYECLTGVRPFDGPSTTAILLNIMSATPAPLAQRAPDVPARIAAIVERAMHRELERRTPDVTTLATELREAAAAESIVLPAQISPSDFPKKEPPPDPAEGFATTMPSGENALPTPNIAAPSIVEKPARRPYWIGAVLALPVLAALVFFSGVLGDDVEEPRRERARPSAPRVEAAPPPVHEPEPEPEPAIEVEAPPEPEPPAAVEPPVVRPRRPREPAIVDPPAPEPRGDAPPPMRTEFE